MNQRQCVSGNDFSFLFFCTSHWTFDALTLSWCVRVCVLCGDIFSIHRIDYTIHKSDSSHQHYGECLIERCQCLTDAQYFRLKNTSLQHALSLSQHFSPLHSVYSDHIMPDMSVERSLVVRCKCKIAKKRKKKNYKTLEIRFILVTKTFVISRFMINFVGSREDYALLGICERNHRQWYARYSLFVARISQFAARTYWAMHIDWINQYKMRASERAREGLVGSKC